MAKENKAKGPGSRPDFATIAGLVVALGAICGGLVLEGGKMSDVLQVTAGMIVLGGTLGAVMVTTPMSTLIGAMKRMGAVFFEKSNNTMEMIEQIVGYSTKARKNSIISLEGELDTIQDPFLKKSLSLAIDGSDLNEIRNMMELDIMISQQHTEAEAKVFEAAGGYSPTIGIIGAVLGLIQVMKHLENIEEVGKGIAVAFVATVYGVATANLFFIPAGAKIKARAHAESHHKELMLEGVCSIVEGMNPKLIRLKLEAFAHGAHAGKKAKGGGGEEPVGATAGAK